MPSRRPLRQSKKDKTSSNDVFVGVPVICNVGLWQKGQRNGHPCKKTTAANRLGKSIVVKGTSPAI
jgi:hypothetical protein